MYSSGVHSVPLHDLGNLLACASHSLQSLGSEMAALHGENEELKKRLGIDDRRKPSVGSANQLSPHLCGDSESSRSGDCPNQPRSYSGADYDAPDPPEFTSASSGVESKHIEDKREVRIESIESKVQPKKGSTVAQAVGNLPTRERSELMVSVWQFLSDPESSRTAYYYSKILDIAIQVSVVLSVLQTLQHPPLDVETFGLVQVVIDLFFLGEFTARFFCAPLFSSFIRSIYNINDLIAGVLPLSCRAASIWFDADLEAGALKYIVFCAAPVLRELKILRRVEKFHLFLKLFEDIKEAVGLLMMLLLIVVLVFSSLLYAVEPAENIGSIPKAVYLTVVTVTTVGYGDLTPESVAGTAIASLLTLFSILYTAMPIGIIGNAFTNIWNDRDRILLMLKTHDVLVQAGYMAEDLPSIFHEYDSTGEGQLDITGFFRMVQDMQVGISEERIVEVFESIDRDGGGSIDEREFVRCIFPSAYHALYTHKQPEAELPAEETDSQSSSTEAKIKLAMMKVEEKHRARRHSERGALTPNSIARERKFLNRGISDTLRLRPLGPLPCSETSGQQLDRGTGETSHHLPKRSISETTVPFRGMGETSGQLTRRSVSETMPERGGMFQQDDRQILQFMSTSSSVSGASRISISTRV